MFLSFKKILSLFSAPHSNNELSGDVIYKNIMEIFQQDIFLSLKYSGAIKDLTLRDKVYGTNLLDTILQNLSFRVAGEFYELSTKSPGGLEALYDDIEKKYGAAANDVFLKTLTSNFVSYVLTAHPTETLTTHAINLERRLSEVMHSTEFSKWAKTGFKKDSKVVYKLKAAITELQSDLVANVPNTNLTIENEIVRGVKQTERFHDATDIFLQELSDLLHEKTGKGITAEIVDKYLSEPLHRVLGWMPTDQDGKKDARPYFIEKKLFKASKVGLEQQYIVQLAKIAAGSSDDGLRDDIKNSIAKIIQTFGDSEGKLASFFLLPVEERERMANSSDKEDKKNTPAIGRYIYDKLYKANNRRFGINNEVILVIEESAKQIVAAVMHGKPIKPYDDIKTELNKDLTEIDKKYSAILPLHKTDNGAVCRHNSVVALKGQVYTTGNEALPSQLRQNSRDVENALVYVLKTISKETEISANMKEMLKLFDMKSEHLDSIKDNSDNARKLEIKILRDEGSPRAGERKRERADILDSISVVDQQLNRTRARLDDIMPKVLEEISNNKEVKTAIQNFIAERDADYFNASKPRDLARKLVLAEHPELETLENDSKGTEKEKAAKRKALADSKQLDIEVYDRLKSVQIMVQNPERLPHYITAECDGANTLLAQHISCAAFVDEGKKVKNMIIPLSESAETIDRLPDAWAKMLESEHIVEQIKSAGRKPPTMFTKDGKERQMVIGDILGGMGHNDSNKKLWSRSVISSYIIMFPSSDIIKTNSGPASNFLIAQVKNQLMQIFAEKGIYLEFHEGVGSNVMRGNPKQGSMFTVQGRDARVSPEAITLRDAKHKAKMARHQLQLPLPESKDPRFSYANDDQLTNLYIANNAERWGQYRAMFTRMGRAYQELYEQASFGKYFSYGSLQEFAKIVSFSARPSIKTGDKAELSIYPKETNVEGIRAIQFAAATSMLNPHGGMMIFSIFEDNNGKFDIERFNAILKDYSKTKPGERNPVLQESINKAAYSLALVDLDNSWRMLGFERKKGTAGAYIEISGERLKLSEVAEGRHDKKILGHVKQSNLYKHISDKMPEDYMKKVEDEVIAIRSLAEMDGYNVKSANYVSMLMKAVKKGKTEIAQSEIGKYKGSSEDIVDAMPYMHKEELKLANAKTSAAFRRLADIHLQLKEGSLELPTKKNNNISEDDKNYPLYKELCYLMAQVMENRERVITALLRPEHAQAIEVQIGRKLNS